MSTQAHELSWLNASCVFIGVLVVVSCAYLAAIFLAADAACASQEALEETSGSAR